MPSIFRALVARLAVVAAVWIASAVPALAAGFVSAPGRVDVAYDTARRVLFISAGDSVLRYDIATRTFLPAIAVGGVPLGMDISPDGNTLAVANAAKVGNTNFVDLVDLQTLVVTRKTFALDFMEGGTYTVAFDRTGQLLVSSSFEGSGWVPLRKLDPVSSAVSILASVRQNSMLSPSPDRRFVGITESNISSGPYGLYRTGDASYQSAYTTGWFTYEVAVSRLGKQVAVPTYGGTYIRDRQQQFPVVGEYAGVQPIGAAYSPLKDSVYFPMAGANYIAEYDTSTMTEIERHTVPAYFGWPGNGAFAEGRTKVAADGSFLFSTLAHGVFVKALRKTPAAD